VRERSFWMSVFFYQHQYYAMPERPQLMLRSVTAIRYTKHAKGATFYTPPADEVSQPGDIGPTVTAGIMAAAALGNAGVRLYSWENPANASSRASSPPGRQLVTGLNSIYPDPLVSENWQAVSNAGRALSILTPYLLANTLNSPAYGRNIITAAREGVNGRMLMIVNCWDYSHRLAVDLAPYSHGGTVTRYIVSAYGNTELDLTGSRTDTRTLKGGETAVYIFKLAKHRDR
jgi:hypothetical protein